MSLDLEQLASKETSTFQLLDGNDEPIFAQDAEGKPTLKVCVTVYGPGSRQYQRAQARASSRQVERLKKRGKFELSADDKLREMAELLADITAGFQNLSYRELEGRELAMAIYGNPALGFIGDQVNKHAGDWANFSVPSRTN